MGNKSLIVMIDDDTDDHEILKMAVDDLDKPMHCLFFPDYESAIAHFSDSAVIPPGYLFIDLKLPRLDGDQCLQQLKKLRSFDKPLIAVSSSYIPNDWRERLSRIGVHEYIQNADSLPALTQQIQAMISAHF